MATAANDPYSNSDYQPTTKVSASIGHYSKAIVALVGSVLTLIAALGPIAGFLPDPVGASIATIIAISTGVVAYLKKNTPSLQQVIDDAASLGLEVKNVRR